MSDIPLWAIFCKLLVRQDDTRQRLTLEVPTGLAARARRLRKYVKAGHVEQGTLHIEGRALPGAMRRLNFPPEVVDLTSEFVELRGVPGQGTPVHVHERRREIIDRILQALKTAKQAL